MVTTEILTSRIRTYEPSFDRRDYLQTDIKDKERLDKYTTRQVETLLGERLNVILSKNRYEVKNNVIYGRDMNEPFVDVMKRGRDYRKKIGGEDRVDSRREQAEIDGFSFTQDVLCNPNTPVGTMVVSVSPPGEKESLYKHNFYDVFTLKKENGEKYVEAKRYSSVLSNEEYKEKLRSFYPKIYGEEIDPTDDYFLSHPVVINNNNLLKNADDVHVYLHKNHEYMEEKDFEQVLRACSPFIERYIRALSENPADVDSHSLILDAVLNKADREVYRLESYKSESIDIFVRPYDSLSLDREIDFLGNQPVRQVSTGCGASGGFSKNSFGNSNNANISSSPFSVAEFGDLNGESYDFDQPGPCKKCGSDRPCGPCGICESCDKSIRASQKLERQFGINE